MTADSPWPPRRRDSNGGRWSTLAKTLHRIDGLVNEPDGPPTPAELAELTAQLAAAATPDEKFVAAEIRAAVLEETGIDLTSTSDKPGDICRPNATPPNGDIPRPVFGPCTCTPEACFADPDDLADECLPCTQLDTCPARNDPCGLDCLGDDHAATPIPGAQRHAPGLTGPPEGDRTGRLTRALRRVLG